jgi:hypothetical protein
MAQPYPNDKTDGRAHAGEAWVSVFDGAGHGLELVARRLAD